MPRSSIVLLAGALRRTIPGSHACGRLAGIVLAAAGLAAGPAPAQQQDYPSKPIRMIVANSAGSSPDIVGRIMAIEMAKFLGQPIIVENRPGASAIIGLEYVAKQVAADGYVFISTAVPALATLPVSVKDLRFDPIKDIPPFIGLIEGPYIFGGTPANPWNNFNEFVAFAKANPNKLNYGSPSSSVRVPVEALINGLGVKIVHVPYTGGAPYNQAVMTGEVQLGLVAEAIANTWGNKFRAIAITGEQRSPRWPDVPTFKELGYPEIRSLTFSLNAPAGTPRYAVDKLHAAALRTLQLPEVKARFNKMGYEITAQPPEVAAKALADEAQFLVNVVKKQGLQLQ